MVKDATEWADAVRQRLETLNQLWSRLDGRTWAPSPVIGEADLAAFESKHNVRLPGDYRAFLTRVGNGGPGPDYGLAPLAYHAQESMPAVTATITTKSGETFSAGTGDRPDLSRPSRLDQPFFLDTYWRAYDDEGHPNPLPEPAMGEAASANMYDGVLEVAEIGCGYYHFLIVTGDRRGQVGVDYTAGDGAVGPTDLTFRDWYDDWLDGSTTNAVNQLIKAALRAGEWEVDPALVEHLPLLEAPVDTRSEPFQLAWLARARHYMGERDRGVALLERLREHPGGAGLVADLEKLLYHSDFELAASGDADELRELVEHPAVAVRLRLFENPAVTPDALERLARDDNESIRLTAAAHPATPAAALAGLVERTCTGFDPGADAAAQVKGVWTFDLLARRADLPARSVTALENFARDADLVDLPPLVFRSLTHRSDRHLRHLEEASRHDAPWVRHAAAIHPESPPKLLAELAGDPHWAVRMGAASNLSCPPEALAVLAGDGAPSAERPNELIKAVAMNPSTEVRTLWTLLYALPRPPIFGLCRNPALPEELMLAMVENLEDANILNLWDRTELPEAVRQALLAHWSEYIRNQSHERAEDPGPRRGTLRNWWDLPDDAPVRDAMTVGEAGVRHPAYPAAFLPLALERSIAAGRPTAAMSIAYSPWCDEAMLAELARHDYAYTRRAVANHPLVTTEILAFLADDPTDLVLGAVAANPKTPLDIVEGLVDHPWKDVRSGAAQQPRAKPEWIEQLFGDDEESVRRVAAENPKATAEMAVELAKAGPSLAWQMTMAPNAPSELLLELADHDDPKTRGRARWRLAGDAFRAGQQS